MRDKWSRPSDPHEMQTTYHPNLSLGFAWHESEVIHVAFGQEDRVRNFEMLVHRLVEICQRKSRAIEKKRPFVAPRFEQFEYGPDVAIGSVTRLAFDQDRWFEFFQDSCGAFENSKLVTFHVD